MGHRCVHCTRGREKCSNSFQMRRNVVQFTAQSRQYLCLSIVTRPLKGATRGTADLRVAIMISLDGDGVSGDAFDSGLRQAEFRLEEK